MITGTQRWRAIGLVRGRSAVRSRDFVAAGVTRSTVGRLCREGVIDRVGRGMYRAPTAPVSENTTLAEVQVRIPGAVICLLTALRFHGLTTQIPAAVWIAIDRKARRPRVPRPALEVVRFSGRQLEIGIDRHVIDKVPVRITSTARTVADCFHYRSKVGLDVAVEALRDYVAHRRGTVDDLIGCARIVRAERVIRPYLEALL